MAASLLDIKTLKVTSAARKLEDSEDEQARVKREREKWIKKCQWIGAIRAELLIEVGMIEIAARLLICLSSVEIRSYRGHIKVIRLQPCKLRFICPMCHYYWRSGHAKKYGSRLRQLANEGYRLYFLTLTVTSVSDLSRCFIFELWECWKRLRHHQLFDECVATLAVMEIRIGASGWQVHFHIILAAKSMIPVEPVRVEWYGLTKDFSLGYQVHIKPVEVATVERLIRYTMKYPRIEKAEDLRALFNTTRGQLLVRATGQVRRSAFSRMKKRGMQHE